MRILIIEDDENKRSQISNFIQAEVSEVFIDTARSYQSGLRAVLKGEVDLILLDMTMPTYDIKFDEDGGQPQTFAGREILGHMERRDIFTPVVIITQFDKFGEGGDRLTFEELNAELNRLHPSNFLGMIYYNASSADWRKPISAVMRSLQQNFQENQI